MTEPHVISVADRSTDSIGRCLRRMAEGSVQVTPAQDLRSVAVDKEYRGSAAEVGEASHRWPRVCISVLNWNSWQDTIECLESVFRLDYLDYYVVVVDNGSTDDSVRHILAWAAGTELTPRITPPRLLALVSPPVDKPVQAVRLQQSDVVSQPACGLDSVLSTSKLAVIETGRNSGYAGGNNVALKMALAAGFEATWILNNDTVVAPDSLTKLAERLRGDKIVGLCGSTILFYDSPETVQVEAGALYCPVLGRQRVCGNGQKWIPGTTEMKVEERLSYIGGESVLVSREFLSAVGLMNEEYFLFFEEIDWAARNHKRFRLAYAPSSIVYHKGGSSSGSGSFQKPPTPMAEYYYARSMMRFTRNWHPACFCSVLAYQLARILRRCARGQTVSAKAMLRGLFGLPWNG